MRNPRDFFAPLAIGAPEPVARDPVKPSRMIHFLDFSNEKMVAKVPDMRRQVDILLGNLEDAVPADQKVAGARRPRSRSAGERLRRHAGCGRASTASTRPWFLDDVTRSSPRSATGST